MTPSPAAENPPISLRQITAASLPDLQDLYVASANYFSTYGGAPAQADQAALAYEHVLDSGDRAILGIWWDDSGLVGCLDVRFHHPHQGVLWFGALILRDSLPSDVFFIASWSIRIFEEWLRLGTDIKEIRLSVLASDRDHIRFWSDLGYKATRQALRHIIAGRSQRFILFKKVL